jgi:NAD(P)-dependent dehydrogenase (short-subunit alcohol dehydrogenase family)
MINDAVPLEIVDAFSVRSQVVIVTGAAGLIGSGIAETFAANGARVVCSDVPSARLTEIVQQLRERGFDAFEQAAELTDPAQLRQLLEAAESHYGRIDAIVNCGGIAFSRPIDEETDEQFDRLFHTNLRSVWLLTRYALEPFARAGGGSIVNIASVNGHRATFPCSLYAGTKAAMIRMTQELAAELAERKIRVNSVSPGAILGGNWLDRTARRLREPYARQLHEQFKLPEGPSEYGRTSQPLPVGGQPRDIAMAVLYLCSPAARFVTGADILVDGAYLHAHTQRGMRRSEQPTEFERFRERLRQHLRALPDEAWIDKPHWLHSPRPR